MATKLFVNLPVEDVETSKSFFAALGFTFFGDSQDMTSVIVSDDTQVMLLGKPTFATYTAKPVADPAAATQVILVLGLENRALVDELVDNALAAGATPAGTPKDDGYLYQRGFADLDGHHWEALCLSG